VFEVGAVKATGRWQGHGRRSRPTSRHTFF
jgi:hypothetical protein